MGNELRLLGEGGLINILAGTSQMTRPQRFGEAGIDGRPGFDEPGSHQSREPESIEADCLNSPVMLRLVCAMKRES